MASPDSELLPAARQHAPDAWDTLLKRHQLPLYTYAAEILHDETAALDTVQETFAAAVRNISSLRDDAKFASWLFSIAHQKCLQHLRRVRRDDALFATDEDQPLVDRPDPEEPDPREMLLQREQAEVFFSLVEQLPAAQRSALLLHVLEDFSLEEIARITSVPIGTVKSRLHNALEKLRHLMALAILLQLMHR